MSIKEISPEQISYLQKIYLVGDYQNLIDESYKLIETYPNSSLLFNIIGIAYLAINDIVNSEQALKKSISINPKFAKPYSNLGILYSKKNETNLAISFFEKSLELDQSNVDVLYNLGKSHFQINNINESKNYYERALTLKHDDYKSLIGLGNLYKKLNEYSKSISYYQKASLNNNSADLKANISRVKNMQGDVEGSIDSILEAIELDQTNGSFYRMLSRLKKFREGDPLIQKIENLVDRNNIDNQNKCELLFALSKAYEDIGLVEDSYHALKAGNKIRKALLNYSINYDIDLYKQIKNTANQVKSIKLNNDQLNNSIMPIFILGMPRSGTSLIEQIISSHSNVIGLGELSYVRKFGKNIITNINKANYEEIIKFRNNYLSSVTKNHHFKQSIFTDKMPNNFLYIGLILAAFPMARIVHTIRDHKAVCWSNFKSYFSSSGLGFAYDLLDVKKFYSMYEDLMLLWNEMYPNKIYNLNYDLLTENQEAEIKKLINFLGLDWENSCLNPHENQRYVETASDQQVRQKIYKKSSDSWKKYHPFLGGIFDDI